MRTLCILILITGMLSCSVYAQVQISNDGSQPDNSAMLDVKSTNMGFLFPRLTDAARNAIPAPAAGLLIYNTTTNRLDYFNGNQWCMVDITVASNTSGSLRAGGGMAINESNTPPDSSAMLDINSQSRGVLIPRTTPGNISAPARGLIIYNTSTNRLNYFNGNVWQEVCSVPTGSPGGSGTQGSLGVTINKSGATLHQSAILDVVSIDKGLLIPRLTENQRNAILPVSGLTIYSLASDEIEYFNGSGWCRLNIISLSAPNEGSHIPSTASIVWNWSTISNATGYKWNATNDYSTALDIGNNATKTETGLTCNTVYTRYAWAYNACGNSAPVTLTQSTSACPPSCGTSITINHIAGSVAPVTKTVIYGIVTNIAGEPSKCWISSNLGSDHQALAATDATESSAGWYWQFNRKQGYKHDGTTVTPAWSILSIIESADWLSVNDPCALQLGSAWRIPTQTEWTNVNAAGAWTNRNDPWNSGLKIHAAGTVLASDGSLYLRGSDGYYRSATQNGSTGSWVLNFSSSECSVVSSLKTHGMPLRCLKAPESGLTSPTVSTSSVSNITQTTATTGGNITSDGGAMVTARGVCWSTSPSPVVTGNHTTDGSGTGTFVSTVAGLIPGTFYYVRAYATNSIGTSYGSQVTFTTTIAGFTCGSLLTINHVAGNVAPVTKTVNYSTVTNIPGETLKCWISSNLGADHQATSVDDATEASAGWYWQFNRTQGYKHDGTMRTPNTAWITLVDENLDWQPGNDPCSLELGSNWRIPTFYEWYNVDAGGNWTTWDGPWNSALKLHAAGFLQNTSGTLINRGFYGYQWSSDQNSSVNGNEFFYCSTDSYMAFTAKAMGNPIRCIRDSQTPSLPTVTTTAITNINPNTATGGGNVSSDGGALVTSRGVCWGVSANPTIAGNHSSDGDGSGTFTSSLTDLAPNTLYYVRAYAVNATGTAYGNQTSFTTLFACGSAMTINHVAGIVAPVSKTVSYSTTTNIPGEPSKCWITSNLGSDHQATSSDDATEASAGWYWQFNRKQGYKHDGTTRTPNSTWITAISEDLDWLPANDPCTIELGSGWRVPTEWEWLNVDLNGGWTYWAHPWWSSLRLHAAGELSNSTGALNYRGLRGSYWSSSQNSVVGGYILSFTWNESVIYYDVNKAYGFPLRCLRDYPPFVFPTVTTTNVSNIGQTTVSSNGNVTSDGGTSVTARGVCWSTSNNPTVSDSHSIDGSGTGTFTSNITNLLPNTLYYIRTYAMNSVGFSYGNTITVTTFAAYGNCGSFTFNHVAGAVAPVTKSSTYNTVSGLPGEPIKCWITKNLGADHEATNVNDNTEPSAGWYWQFNRKQGYKHDGTTRTPNTAWITTINENLDWLPANDPCALEFGNGWRIPTAAEWTNVRQSANWTNWNGPWNSGLKLHAAGGLSPYSGNIFDRGTNGEYWRNSQGFPSSGGALSFDNAWCSMVTMDKSSGSSLRCIRETTPIVTTATVMNVSPSSATSGGNITSDGGNAVTARGVCWGTVTNPTTLGSHTSDGASNGIFVSNITGLSGNTQYFMRAYATNSSGTTYGNEVSFTTLSQPWSCGNLLPVYHSASAVAPVSKSVSYGTVTNIPGEPSKCWITSNLGSDHQAISVDDATEASAGWYWQFNRQQGYKHDGSTRTPNSTWITSISENSGWLPANDPCTLELGNGWRIPTSAEWTNVDASGNWSNWNGPWSSGLKLHASAYLNDGSGTLGPRGSDGSYWSSTQSASAYSYNLNFTSGSSSIHSGDPKAAGFTLRCLRDN